MGFVRFEGANMRETDDGREYTERGPIYISPKHVTGFYDHTILTEGHKIRVMDDITQIREKLRGPQSVDEALDLMAGW